MGVFVCTSLIYVHILQLMIKLNLYLAEISKKKMDGYLETQHSKGINQNKAKILILATIYPNK